MVTSQTYKLTDYPKEITLRDGARVVLKPMTHSDADALLHFFNRVPPEDWYYLKEEVTSPKVIQRWAAELDYDRALPLLAWVNERVVADASLHRTRSLARHHVGEIRVVVEPEYRNRGLGSALMRELAGVATRRGLERLFIEMVSEGEERAIKVAESLGFVRLAVLPKHAKDLDGNYRDIVLLEMPLGT